MVIKFIQLYTNYIDAILGLTDEECGRVIKALMVFAVHGTHPHFEPRSLEAQAFAFMARQFKDDKEAYKRKVEGGAKGGRPRRSKNKEGETDPETAPEQDKENHQNLRFSRFPYEEKRKEEKRKDEKRRESSSYKEEGFSPDDRTTTPAPESVLNAYGETFGGQAPGFVQTRLAEYAQALGEPLVLRIFEECRANGARSWKYADRALAEVNDKKVTLEEYEHRHRPGVSSGRVVDRPAPSGNDILKRRPGGLKLKRED